MLGGDPERLGPLGVEGFGKHGSDALNTIIVAVLPSFGDIVEVAAELFGYTCGVSGSSVGFVEKMSGFLVAGDMNRKEGIGSVWNTLFSLLLVPVAVAVNHLGRFNGAVEDGTLVPS